MYLQVLAIHVRECSVSFPCILQWEHILVYMFFGKEIILVSPFLVFRHNIISFTILGNLRPVNYRPSCSDRKQMLNSIRLPNIHRVLINRSYIIFSSRHFALQHGYTTILRSSTTWWHSANVPHFRDCGSC